MAQHRPVFTTDSQTHYTFGAGSDDCAGAGYGPLRGAHGFGLEDSHGSGGFGRGGFGQDPYAGGSRGSDGYGHAGAHYGAAPAHDMPHSTPRAAPRRVGNAGREPRARAHYTEGTVTAVHCTEGGHPHLDDEESDPAA